MTGRNIVGRHVKPLADRLGLQLDQTRTLQVTYEAGHSYALVTWEGAARLPVDEVARLIGNPEPAPIEPCPECVAGKHGNCDGNAWDPAADDVAPCPCGEAGHA